MRLNTVPARQGFLWVRLGFQAWWRKPLVHSLLLSAFLFGALALLMLPVVGLFALLMALPLVSLGFMIATQRTVAGLPVGPGVFLDGLRGPPAVRQAMWVLLLLYAALNLGAMALADVVDAGRLEALQTAVTAETTPDPAAMQALLSDPRLFWGMVIRLGLTALLSIPFWHAPALVHWQQQGVAQSLFSSTLACWRNRSALTCYGMGWMLMVLSFSAGSNLLLAILGEPQLIALMVVPAGLVFSTAFYASLYFTYADSFVPDPPPTQAPALDPRSL